LAGVKGVPVEARIKILKLIENMSGGTALAESMHGAGFPQTRRSCIVLKLEQRKDGNAAGIDRTEKTYLQGILCYTANLSGLKQP
jgi:4-hydroxybutyryl-CoA dehydratase/vinylacetyl-CoA-Delta-isomerase